MTKTIASQIPARLLEPGDCFKMGGQMYRVINVESSRFVDDHRTISFISALAHNPRTDFASMVIPNKFMFKVYNRQ